jgi:hypothetical protein
MKYNIQYNEPFKTTVKEIQIEVENNTLQDGNVINPDGLYEIYKSRVKGQFYMIILQPEMERVATNAFFAFLLERHTLNNFENFK